MPPSITVSRYSRILVENRYTSSLYSAPPLGVKSSDLRNNPWWRKTRMICLSAVLIQNTRVTDRRTDEIAVAYTCYSIFAVARKNVILNVHQKCQNVKTLSTLVTVYIHANNSWLGYNPDECRFMGGILLDPSVRASKQGHIAPCC